MSDRYEGGILSGTAPTVTQQGANGVYTLSQELQYQGQGVWPAAAQTPILKSLRFRSSASAYLNRTPSASNRQTWTWSAWVKRGTSAYGQLFGAYIGSGSTDTNYFDIAFNNDAIQIGGYSTTYRKTTAVYRDFAAWYHIVVALDTTQATGSNRLKVYVNGTQVTAFSTSNDPAQNANLGINGNYPHGVSAVVGNAAYFDGYMAEVNFIDGVALTASSFGTTDVNGIWQPIPYAGAYGTNGFYLKFTDTTSTSTLGTDSSGNSNNWTVNNISLTAGSTYDSMLDSPSNASSTIANYCTLNPLQTAGTLSSGNLAWSGSNQTTTGTIGVTDSAFYFEVRVTTYSSGNGYIGICNQTWQLTDGSWGWDQIFAYVTDGRAGGNGAAAAYGATYTAGDTIGVAFDVTGNTITFYKNGVSQGVAFTTGFLGKTWRPFVYFSASSAFTINFGQQPFTYTPPTGFNRLNTYNLPVPTIPAGNKVMDVSLYTGNSSTQTITNSGSMKPDFVWTKSRSSTYSNLVVDSVRGVTKELRTNGAGAEATNSGLTAFNSNGYSLGSYEDYNFSGVTYVGWQWQAGQGVTSSNTNGSITSTTSVNTTAGFSVVTYTGTGAAATVGHGLGVTPGMILLKCRTVAHDWRAFHGSFTSGNSYLRLNTTAAVASSSTIWNGTLPTSSVFSLGTDGGTNESAATFVAYCFAPVAGYSAFGSYTGNGSTDGPFVYLGFRPRWIMFKDTGALSQWRIWDTSRDTYNVATNALYANQSLAEQTTDNYIDILSNGFKVRSTNAGVNTSSENYIYMAFAENPFKMARAR